MRPEINSGSSLEPAATCAPDAPHHHFIDRPSTNFHHAEKSTTVVLIGGLTDAHNRLVAGALQGAGYRARALPEPDLHALHLGKEYCSRGQCNPAYFMTGNLLAHLIDLRDRQGLGVEEIIAGHVFLTVTACGPCRFGSYATEYRKALRDAGFEGFRIMLAQQRQGLRQVCGEGDGIVFDLRLSRDIASALLAADVLNIISYRTRPYETEAGATDRALERCKAIMARAFGGRHSILLALRRCRREFAEVRVDRSRSKLKVALIGEFWAMTTEGDGNYRLQRFLESEGAEVEIQPLCVWLLYLIWQGRFDTRRRMHLPATDGIQAAIETASAYWRLSRLWSADKAVRLLFLAFATAAGLHRYHLPDMDHLARIANAHYDVHLRGGEGHLEVAKLIDAAQRSDCDLVVSVKPFGCLPSSGVSDGIQARVATLHPEVGFISVETTGDGGASVHSRLQMAVFKAREHLSRRRHC